MAQRYSGDITVTCTYRDGVDYRCVVTPKGERGKTIYVRPPASGYGAGVSYDSPRAYDEVARAAISFAADEGLDVERADLDGSGFVVRRESRRASTAPGGGGARNRPSKSVKPPVRSFKSPKGRTFTIRDGTREIIPSRWMETFPVFHEGKQAGSVSDSNMYVATKPEDRSKEPEGKGQRWTGELNKLRWGTPGFASAAPNGLGYDVAAFDTASECLLAWGRKADEILDWADRNPRIESRHTGAGGGAKAKARTRRHGGGGANMVPSMPSYARLGGGGARGRVGKPKGLSGLPTIEEVYDDLVGVRKEIEGYGDVPDTDVRLQVHEGSWSLHSGDAQYDTDHRGYWGAASVSVDDTNATLRQTAKDLIRQVEEDHAMR